MGVLIQLSKFRARYNQARFYWRMTKCNARELSQHSGITYERAVRWELAFAKEKKLEGESNVKK